MVFLFLYTRHFFPSIPSSSRTFVSKSVRGSRAFRQGAALTAQPFLRSSASTHSSISPPGSIWICPSRLGILWTALSTSSTLAFVDLNLLLVTGTYALLFASIFTFPVTGAMSAIPSGPLGLFRIATALVTPPMPVVIYVSGMACRIFVALNPMVTWS